MDRLHDGYFTDRTSPWQEREGEGQTLLMWLEGKWELFRARMIMRRQARRRPTPVG